jgi:hypothetical protein
MAAACTWKIFVKRLTISSAFPSFEQACLTNIERREHASIFFI